MFIAMIRNAGLVAVLVGAIVTAACAQAPFGTPNENSAFSIPDAQQIQPAELSKVLSVKSADKPKLLVLQVGSRVLFDQAHIAGSEYAGPGSRPAGLELLKKRVADLPRDKEIVLYCGCCPWNRCPNVGPAFRLISGMGFTHVKVLYIGNNFGSDWVEKGYPVERSH